MPREQGGDASRRHGGVRKRAPNACTRCRQQKIKCSGSLPCDECNKRHLSCSFDDRSQKILVSRGFIVDLERRAALLERRHLQQPALTTAALDHNASLSLLSGHESPEAEDRSVGSPDYARHISVAHAESVTRTHNVREAEPTTQCHSAQTPEPIRGRETIPDPRPIQELGQAQASEPVSASGPPSPTSHLINPIVNNTPSYIADRVGKRWYLGTSSNWSFNWRVLSMAHERVTGAPLSTENMLCDGMTYDLGWNGQRILSERDTTILPSSDHAIYLINAVKFHCGQMFHLFDEESFMRHFSEFHDNPEDTSKPRGLWYIHYLLVLAFGKAFVVQGNSSRTPPGADLFVQALKLLPDMIALYTHPVHSIEVLCCAALYLQCLDFRRQAYSMIGQALRIALEEGMHTSMQSEELSEKYIERCRNAWWTVHILDRQLSSLLGVPLAVRDEDISASLPTFSGSRQKSTALKIHVELSRVISQILNTVYSVDGRLSRRFTASTKAALNGIAGITDQLMSSFELPKGDSMVGLSRLSAYLHLLHHQCIVLATRPLLFCFLKKRLDAPDAFPIIATSLGSANTLLSMCVKSSQHILNILTALKAQNLLETFLPFDLEAAFAASMALLLAPVVEASLLENPSLCIDMAYRVLDEMAFRGNRAAAARRSELQQLESTLKQIPSPTTSQNTVHGPRGSVSRRFGAGRSSNAEPLVGMSLNELQTQQARDATEKAGGSHGLGAEALNMPAANDFMMEDMWNFDGYTADQLFMAADNLDLDGLDWMTTSSFNLND